MAEFLSLLETLAMCATVFFVALIVLLALPKSRLRTVGIQCLKYAVAVACALLVVSPVDLLPFVPLDDIGYVVGGVAAVRSARADRRRSLLEEQCDAANAALMARFSSESGQKRGGGNVCT